MNKGGKRALALRPKLLAISVAACFAFSTTEAPANPTNPTVIQGVGPGGFSGLGTSALSVTTQGNAIINWGGFSIGVNEITRFIQQSAGNAVLNRVTGGELSSILGTLQSNGRVWLINPNGIVFGAGARIDVAGLVASSLDVTNQDFINGRLRFAENPGAGLVANHGVIETPAGGRVFLVAPDVQNTGIIRAPQGEIVLAAGKSAELVTESSPYVTVNVVADSEQALNVGQLIADSGRIGMYGALVRNAGVAEASGAVVDAAGSIRFVATKDLTVDAGSRVAANGASGGDILLQAKGGTNLISGTVEATGASGKGGNVQALGVRVGVIGNGVIDASGETGGGSVMVGGDYQGKNPGVQNAEWALVGRDGIIRADARNTGDGGRVIIWSDSDTRFYGSVSARGGEQSGNGGFVEVSGKQHLAFHGHVDTRAPKGQSGTLLLDPADIVIKNGLGEGDDTDFYVNSFSGFGTPPDSIIYESELEGTAATTSVVVAASNSVVIEPLTTDGVLFLAKGGSFTAGAGGITMQDTSNTMRTDGSALSFSAPGGSITLGHLDTSNNGGSGFTSPTSVSIMALASAGPIQVGSIRTGSTSGASSAVDITGSDDITLNGAVQTGSSADSHVEIRAGQNSGTLDTNGHSITTPGGYVVLRGGCGECGGLVAGGSNITTNGGSVEVRADDHVSVGTINTASASPSSTDTTVTIVAADGGNSNGGITVGSITTGDTVSLNSNVHLSAYEGVTVNGTITTGQSSTDSGVFLGSIGGSAISTGAIRTGTASYTGVDIDAGGGSVTIGVDAEGFSIRTGDAGDISKAKINNTSSISLAGAIKTGSAVNGDQFNGGSSVSLFSSGAVNVGGIQTGSSYYSVVDIDANSVMVNGPIVTTGPADGGEFGYGEAWVQIRSNSGNLQAGSITTNSAGMLDGAEGWVDLEAWGGNVVAGAINTGAGTGQSPRTRVSIDADGSVTTGSITTGQAWESSSVEIFAAGSVTVDGSIKTGMTSGDSTSIFISSSTGSITVTGDSETGSVTNCCSSANIGYYGSTGVSTGALRTGGSVFFGNSGRVNVTTTSGSVVTGPISTRANFTARSGSDVNLAAYGGSVTVNGGIDTRGADGVPEESNYYGGAGGRVLIVAAGGSATVNGSIVTSGGAGATGWGGNGGNVTISGASPVPGSIAVNGLIDTHGGAGGTNGAGEPGGYGGNVTLLATESVKVGPPATVGVQRTVIDTSGGAGGAASGAFAGGAGGAAGDIFIDPAAITINGIIMGVGGAGGAGSPGGNGGAGALLNLIAAGGTITFVNGGYDISGGAGGAVGGLAGANGIATTEGTLIFLTLLNDALSNPAVVQAITGAIKDTAKAAGQGEEGSAEDDEERDKKKQRSQSCRP
jgi:filamentous hemagglutinin family protein